MNQSIFQHIYGNARTVKSMRYAINEGRVSHAFVLEGPEGSGKTTLAQAFAQALLCENPAGGPESCQCRSCLRLRHGNHPDVAYIRPQKTKTLGVDDIRQVNQDVNVRPFASPYKVYILYADGITPAAQNAFLKTLEEPPAYAVFLLLTCHVELLLPTILSRCVRYQMERLPDLAVREYLLEQGAAPSVAEAATLYAQGSIGQALQLSSDERFMAILAQMRQVMERVTVMDLAEVFTLAREFDTLKEDIQTALDMAALWYREALCRQEADGKGLLIAGENGRTAKYLAEKLDKRALLRGFDAVLAAKRQLTQNVNFQLAIEGMLLRIYGKDAQIEGVMA